MAKEIDHSFKLFVLGDMAVGKTCFILRYTEEKFADAHITTVGVDFRFKIIVKNNQKIRLQIWDTAGQERFRTVTTQMYKNAQGILILYDITKRETFEQISEWVEQIEANIKPNIARVIIANKCDMINERVVTKEEGMELAEKCNMMFYETSAKTGENINEVFDEAIDFMIKSKGTSTPGNFIVKMHDEQPKKKCCK